jgi:DNA repair exonuclease SbcCD ATPase subunit
VLHVSKKRLILSVIVVILFLAGCAPKTTPVDKMYNVLEQVAVKEKGFEEQQGPLVTLEKQEKNIYDQIIQLGTKDYDKIVKLSNEAIASADKRKDFLDKETNSLQQSEKEFKKITAIKQELTTDLKKRADELYNIMMQRYQAHDELYQEYSDAIQADKQLYEMFKNKNLPLTELEAQVNKNNEVYKMVTAANNTFNKFTEQYNAKKLEFYKKAGLNTK